MTGTAIKKAKKERWFTRDDVYDVISMLLIAASLMFSVWEFLPVFGRTVRAFVDVGTSLAYYFTELSGFKGLIVPTVAEIPEGLNSLLPMEWETFRGQLEEYGRLLISEENLQDFFQDALSTIADNLTIFILFLPILLLLGYGIYYFYHTPKDLPEHELTAEEEQQKEDTRPKALFKKIESVVYVPVKNFISGYIYRLREHPLPFKLMKIIWFYNLNLITISVGLFAYAIYFCVGSITKFSIHALYAQVVKISADITVALNFLPWWAKAIIGFKIFDVMRKKIGVAALHFFEECNRAFLKLYLGALFIVGKQRAKKTSIVTDMCLSQEVVYREDAMDNAKKRDKQFPNFPWRRVEELYWKSLELGTLPTLASIREFVRELRYRFEQSVLHPYWYSDAQRWPHMYAIGWDRIKSTGYKWNDFIFGYDWRRYGLTFDDNLKEINIFEAIEAYMQHFYVYACPTSLIFSNYAIRTDIRWEDYGYWPDMDADFFNVSSSELDDVSQYSKIGNQDYVRLGKRFDDMNVYVNGFEFGVWGEMEVAKERGNQISNSSVKATDENINAKNDMREINFKMQGHASTIDNYTYFRPIMDDQRPDSLGADNKDLCDVLMIKEVSDANLVMPGFMFEEWLYAAATGLHDAFYYLLRKMGKENGLLVYLMRKLYHPIFAHYWRIINKFSVYTASLRIWNAMSEEVLKTKAKYYICTFKTYRERFATDGIKMFYHAKALQSKYGTYSMPTYADKQMSVDEMVKNNSLFYSKLIKMFLSDETGKLSSSANVRRLKVKKA